MRKIAVTLTKGGIGKTTTAVNLAAGLAQTGKRVLLVDTDTQDQAAFMLGVAPAAGIGEVILEQQSLERAITGARDGLWLLCGGDGIAAARRGISQQTARGETALSRALAPLDGRFDVVVLDTAPGWDEMTVNVLFYADEILAPVSLELLALKGLVEFVKRVEAVQPFRPIALNHVLPTFMDQRVRKSKEILGQIHAFYGERVCEPVRYNVRLSEAPGFGQTIFEYAPASKGAEDYRKLTERIIRHGNT